MRIKLLRVYFKKYPLPVLQKEIEMGQKLQMAKTRSERLDPATKLISALPLIKIWQFYW